MREISILLAPVFWSIKNDITRFKWTFYKKIFFYVISGGVFIFLITELLNIGMAKLQSLSPDVFNVLLIKGYSLIFIIIFFIQIVNGFIISLNTYYQSKELEVLFTSPVKRTSLFFSILFETHLKASWMLVIFGLPLLISSGILYQANLFYYLYSLILFVAFSIIPVNIGTGVAILISSIFNIRRLKKFILSLGIASLLIIIILLRFFKPERFVNPELFANLTLFLAEINTPSFILLPNRWINESIFNYLGGTFSSITVIFSSLIFLTAYITAVPLEMIFRKYHYGGWSRFHNGEIIFKGKKSARFISSLFGQIFYIKPLKRLLSALDNQAEALFKRDFLCQIRDEKNIHRILIILSLILVYLFSIASLPLNWERYAIKLKYIVSFLNLGLIMIIIASLCSRIIYPAIVSEGPSMWLIKTSPIKPNRYIWTRFFFLAVPVILSGQILTIFSSYFINIETEYLMLIIMSTVLVSFSLASMSVVFGIYNLKHTINEYSKEQTKAGGLIYMITSIFLIIFTLFLQIVPIYLSFMKEATKIEFTHKSWLIIGGVILILFFINFFITLISMRLSIKKFAKLQFN